MLDNNDIYYYNVDYNLHAREKFMLLDKKGKNMNREILSKIHVDYP